MPELALDVSPKSMPTEITTDSDNSAEPEVKELQSESLVGLLKGNNKVLNRNNITLDSPHNYVRDSERAQVIEVLKENKFINIYSDWGCSRNEFIDSICEAEDSIYKNYSL
ncbi:hypothetical protein CRN40_19450, partial [Vibrio vulnificus]